MGDDNVSSVVNMKVLILERFDVQKGFHYFDSKDLSLQDMEDILNLPTFLNRQYFAIWFI